MPADAESPRPDGAAEVRSTMRRYFASNAGRSQIPPQLVASLEGVRQRGFDMFALLQPFAAASVFDYEFAAQLGSDAAEAGNKDVSALGTDATSVARDALDAAAMFMGKKFQTFPATDDPDLETTSAMQGLFFIAAVAVYCPEIILESGAASKDKTDAAEKFLLFFSTHAASLTDLNVRWQDAPRLHSDCLEVYSALKTEMPELFQNLRERLWVSGGELMAPYGSDQYDYSWISFHYRGKL